MNTKRIGLFVVGLFSFLLALEATVRIEDWIRFGTPPLVDALSQSDLIASDSLGTHGRPNGRFRKWKLDSLGFRGPEISRRPAPGTIRVVTTGASETFGLVEDSGKEFPRQLEDSLNAWLGRLSPACPADIRFEVVNAALPGMYLPTAITDVQGRLATISPAAVLYYPTPPQYLDIEPPRAYTPGTGAAAGNNPWRPFYPRSLGGIRDAMKGLIPTFLSTRLRRSEIDRVAQSHAAGWQFTSVPEDRLTGFESDIRSLVGAIRGIGAVPILATHANAFGAHHGEQDEELLLMWQRYSPRATGATLIAFDSAADARLQRVAADSNVLLVRVDSTVYASGADGLFGDYAHFSNTGAGYVATAAAHPILNALLPKALACSRAQPGAASAKAPVPAP
jgi:hypothetical protein